MQPYFFPYQGYFKLINSVDLFVIYDDVNYINRGWINRNYIILNGKKKLITMPLVASSQNKLINDINVDKRNHKLIETIRHAYSKSVQFKDVYPIIAGAIDNQETNLGYYLTHQLKDICKHINIKTKFIMSSEINKDNKARGIDKIIAICKKLGANTYINLPGGRDLYDFSVFSDNKIELKFSTHEPKKYHQLSDEWVPNLSIIDLMMNVKKTDLLSYMA
ncbi:WbqC family protein [Synechococcus sp. AH-551-A10]|nr:WbqC family protein [Synechococcus sp. AH-551-A10]MDB4682075.1 WbqC family protein [Synechococcus sp. AH-551-A10]